MPNDGEDAVVAHEVAEESLGAETTPELLPRSEPWRSILATSGPPTLLPT